jgi:hypothetical protein
MRPISLATRGLFTDQTGGGGGEVTEILTAIQASLTTQAGTLDQILNQLIADWRKGETKYQRFLPGTNTLILDKDVTFDPDEGFIVTQA